MKRLMQIFWFVCIAAISLIDLHAQEINQVTLNAYNLRMNGNADSAKIMLENFLKVDTTNAMVLYEYARTLYHITPLQRDSLNKTIYTPRDSINLSLAHRSIDIAIELFQNNYQFYWAKLWIPQIREKTISWDSLTDYDIKIIRENIGYLEKAFALSPDNGVIVQSLRSNYFRLHYELTKADSLRLSELDSFLEKKYNYRISYSENGKEFHYKKSKEEIFNRDKPEERLNYYKTQWKRDKGNSEMAYILSGMYFEFKKPNKAVRVLKITTEKDPETYKIYLKSGTELYRYSWYNCRKLKPKYMRKAKNIIKGYIKSAPITPYKIDALKELALIYELNSENDEAIKIREKAKSIDPYIYARKSAFNELYIPPGEVAVQVQN